jgi:hypothetical protein
VGRGALAVRSSSHATATAEHKPIVAAIHAMRRRGDGEPRGAAPRAERGFFGERIQA